MRITWGQIEHQILLSLVLFAVFVTSGNFDPGFPRGGERGGGGTHIKVQGCLSQILKKKDLRGIKVKFCGVA